MESWTAFLLGLAGSAHCAGMCGPLALALPRRAGSSPAALVVGRLSYNAGRVGTYGAMGFLLGWVGRGLALSGVQRWVSLVLGVGLLAGAVSHRWGVLRGPNLLAWAPLRRGFGRLLQRPGPGALAALGGLNGLLPCGLVYAACAGAALAGSGPAGAGYMMLFGLGTVPMMFGLGLAGGALQGSLRQWLQRAVPVCLALMGLLLVVRGLGLGIPYLSPDLGPTVGGEAGAPSCCH